MPISVYSQTGQSAARRMLPAHCSPRIGMRGIRECSRVSWQGAKNPKTGSSILKPWPRDREQW